MLSSLGVYQDLRTLVQQSDATVPNDTPGQGLHGTDLDAMHDWEGEFAFCQVLREPFVGCILPPEYERSNIDVTVAANIPRDWKGS